jgi:putative two-component system response regulator
MGHYARLLAQAIGLPEERQELLFLAAPMHDIGKVAIPDRILLKPGKLTPSEWETMKTHAQAGYEILKDSDSQLVRLGAEIALTHHEMYDGSGYPRGLAGELIPLPGRICAITDVFDALLSVRPYKPAWSLPDTIEALKRKRGAHFDPKLVDAFLDKMPEVQKIRMQFSDSEAA